MAKESEVDVVKGELCPMCKEKKLVLTEAEKEVPFFGKCYLFGMDCEGCGYHKADVEAAEQKEPVKYTVEVSEEKDMHIRIVKSSQAIIKIPHVGSIEPGPSSNGYVTNIEGILNRMKKQIEFIKESEEDKAAQKKAKNLIKKLTRVIWGQEKLKIILEDPSGNSAIISEKAEKAKLKK